jgi:hypothetical protein
MVSFMSHLAPSELRAIGQAITMIASMAGAFIAIFAGIWSAKHPGAQGFDFVASARRIRAMPIPARGDAKGS